MTIGELIEKLEAFDPEQDVYIMLDGSEDAGMFDIDPQPPNVDARMETGTGSRKPLSACTPWKTAKRSLTKYSHPPGARPGNNAQGKMKWPESPPKNSTTSEPPPLVTCSETPEPLMRWDHRLLFSGCAVKSRNSAKSATKTAC